MSDDRYPSEALHHDVDNGTMPRSREDLAEAVVGHRIVSAEMHGTDFLLTLDNGTRVRVSDRSDCCAYTEVLAFMQNPELVDHIIVGVGTTDKYTTWHIYADAGDFLKLTVAWSAGNPFYYGYGFRVEVEPA